MIGLLPSCKKLLSEPIRLSVAQLLKLGMAYNLCKKLPFLILLSLAQFLFKSYERFMVFVEIT